MTGTATNASIIAQGLLFASTGTDPRLEGSAVDYPSSPSWQSFKVSFNMRVTPPTNATGELYFGPSFTAANRATFTITSGTAFYTYSIYIPLQGAGSRLRLDPGNQVTSVTIAWIRVEASDSYGAPQSLNTYAYNQTLQVSATVQETPPTITLQWPKSTDAQVITIYRKAKDDTSWGTAIATVAATATLYADSSVSLGGAYEYKLYQASTYGRYGYIYSGIRAPLVDDRGKVILLADASVASSLTAELATLMLDLTGDGWQVIRHDVARTSSVASIKALLKSDYDADPVNVKALYIFGHVPVPYSGQIAPDGHGDHVGAWPADCFYGEMTDSWTDTSVNYTASGRAANRNIPGDGKYDQSDLSSDLELMVGRVDCYNMPAFKLSETELLRQYLNKSHNYKNAIMTAPARVMVRDNFTGMGEGFAQSGWRLASQVGAQNVEAGYWAGILSHLLRSDYLWAYGCGGGNYNGASGVANTTDFAANTYRAYFTMLFGSYFGDWDNSNNFLRAPLCLPTYGLICAWAGRPHWYFHHSGLGEPVGHALLLSSMYIPRYNMNGGGVHVALMGDPTLRTAYVAPATSVTAVWNETAARVYLSWTSSRDPILGYYVYRSSGMDAPFTRITSFYLPGRAFVDNSPMLGRNIYMIRPIRIETSASGAYYNAGVGAFAETYVTPPTMTVDLLRDYLLGKIPSLTSLQRQAADVNHDGVIDLADLVELIAQQL
ncbi:MAG: dockerin type I repeat-containing protein [Candidatus Sumerlaeota bacterium]|nr:dockerin type I repeat-containing protein [Candidatus Sumerlaeota bacterium]